MPPAQHAITAVRCPRRARQRPACRCALQVDATPYSGGVSETACSTEDERARAIVRLSVMEVRDPDAMGRRPPDEHDVRASDRHELVGLAAILSFLIPGLGHLFIGAWLRGAVWLAGWLVVPAAGGGGVHRVVVALMFIAGLDALLYERSRDA
jgi:hypothetical protein